MKYIVILFGFLTALQVGTAHWKRHHRKHHPGFFDINYNQGNGQNLGPWKKDNDEMSPYPNMGPFGNMNHDNGNEHNFGPWKKPTENDDSISVDPYPNMGPFKHNHPGDGYNYGSYPHHFPPHYPGPPMFNGPNMGPFGPPRAPPIFIPVPIVPPAPVVPSTTETLEACMRRCPVTSEYNPVCGTDNVTYDNMGRLECACNCGAEIQILKFGTCTATNQVDVLRCMKDCRIKNELSPVCGTNNVTYANIEGLECVQRCGVNVVFSKNGLCEVEPAPSPPITERKCIETSTQPPQPTSTGAAKVKPPTDAEIAVCMHLCPFSTEDEPVCATDGITYKNPRQVLCFIHCGVDLKVKSFTACPSSEESNTESTVPGSSGPEDLGPNDSDEQITVMTTESDPLYSVDERHL